MKKIFLWIFLVLLWLGGYFYFFPIYPNYNISDDYFNTTHYNKSFDSSENAYKKWVELNRYLWENKEFLDRILNFYVCVDVERWNCHIDIGKECREKWFCKNSVLKDQEKEYVVDYFKNLFEQSKDKDKLDNIITTYLQSLEDINRKDYLLFFNKDNVFEEVIPMSSFINLNKIIKYLFSSKYEKNYLKLFLENYSSIVSILNKSDLKLMDGLVFITTLEIHLPTFEKLITERNFIEYKAIVIDTMKINNLKSWFMMNAIKNEYHFVYLLMKKELFNNQKLWFSPKLLFLYSEPDTFNLLKKQFKSILEHEKLLNIKLNGRNFIWRILINSSIANYDQQMKKEQDLIDKIEKVKNLLTQ